MMSAEHKQHITDRMSHNNCPECRADCSRRFAKKTPFHYGFVHEYLSWARPLVEAIRAGKNGGDTDAARRWQSDFLAALHNRINSHIQRQSGRKYAPEYAKYHLSTYGNDYRFLHAL